MDMVRIRANIAAHGMRKGAETTVAETSAVAGGIKNGVFTVLERFPSTVVPPLPETPATVSMTPTGFEDLLVDALTRPITEPDDPTHLAPDDEPAPVIEDLELPGG